MFSEVVDAGKIQFLVVLPEQLVVFPELPDLGGGKRDARAPKNRGQSARHRVRVRFVWMVALSGHNEWDLRKRTGRILKTYCKT